MSERTAEVITAREQSKPRTAVGGAEGRASSGSSQCHATDDPLQFLPKKQTHWIKAWFFLRSPFENNELIGLAISRNWDVRRHRNGFEKSRRPRCRPLLLRCRRLGSSFWFVLLFYFLNPPPFSRFGISWWMMNMWRCMKIVCNCVGFGLFIVIHCLPEITHSHPLVEMNKAHVM